MWRAADLHMIGFEPSVSHAVHTDAEFSRALCPHEMVDSQTPSQFLGEFREQMHSFDYVALSIRYDNNSIFGKSSV